MAQTLQTPISQEVWQGLVPGKRIRDAYGRIWEVKRRDPSNPNRLFAKCPGYDEERLEWHEGQIMDEEWGIMVELNNSQVEVVDA